jgi:ribose transport system permease protein
MAQRSIIGSVLPVRGRNAPDAYFDRTGSFVAVYFLVTGITGLTILGIQTFVQNLCYGGGLVLAVALSQLVRNRGAQDFS